MVLTKGKNLNESTLLFGRIRNIQEIILKIRYIAMPHSYCPCGTILDGIFSARPSKSPCLRLFISIRTMKSISPEGKVCDACRRAYYTWKNNNGEFGNIFSRIEQELSDVEEVVNGNSVNKKLFVHLK